jgi:anti-sigma B factor antagonist
MTLMTIYGIDELGRRSPVQLEYTNTEVEGIHVLSVSGEIDMMTKGAFEDALNSALADGNFSLVIDLKAVRYMDSSGFNALVQTQRQLSARSRKLYVVSNALVRRIFWALKLSQLFDLYESRDVAIATSLAERSYGEVDLCVGYPERALEA